MKTSSVILELVKIGIRNSDVCRISEFEEWSEALGLASFHDVGAIALDGIQRCYDKQISLCIDLHTKLEWISVAQHQESVYRQQEEVLASLAHFYQQHDIKTMVLKGWGLSLNYPIPSHRSCCDLDIFLCGENECADKFVESELGIKVNHSHHCHTVFRYKGVYVERHYDFLNVYSHRSNRKIDVKLKEICSSEYRVVTLHDEYICLPSPNFNALFVLRHMGAEFAATGMKLRQVLDWGFFIKNYHTAIDWSMIIPIVTDLNMYHFMEAVNYICYTYLGFEKESFHGIGDDSYGERVLLDIFNPENAQPKEKGIVKYVIQRTRNWWRNRWRHEIVYSDSLFSTFVCQIVAHLMKPATLFA